MNDNRNKKDFHSSKKRSFNKSGNNINKFGGKKKYPSKYSFADKGEYSNKSADYPEKKTFKKYDSSSSDKEFKSKKYYNDKPYGNDDTQVNKSSESKYNKPYKDKKAYNREDKPYGNKNKYEKKTYRNDKPGEYNSDKPYNREKPTYKKVFKKDNDYDKEKTYPKPYERIESSYSNDRYEKKEHTFKKKLVKKESYNDSENNETYSKPYKKNEGTYKKKLIKSFEKEETSEDNNEYGGQQGSFRKKLTKKNESFGQDLEDTNEKPYYKKRTSYDDKSYGDDHKRNEKKLYSASEKSVKIINPSKTYADGAIRLNKYIASSGICSRREADELIASGAVMVNGKVVTEMGIKVLPTDVVAYGGETLKNEKNIYLLLNKPKDFITTSDDPFNRKTVMSLVHRACKERIYPVGRLDRMTTGLLLFTNDGEMAKKLTHPKHGIKKIYQVELDKPLTKTDMTEIVNGVELEDGLATVDIITYIGDGTDKKTLGLELHSGKNRIVRRIFEHLGYNVVKLDRVYFAGLTKKDLPRGKHRFLTDIEINMLKLIG